MNVIKIFLAVLKRVGEVLDMEELEVEDDTTDIAEETRIHIDSASFTWGFSVKKDKNTAKTKVDDSTRDTNLDNINFSAKITDLVAIVGEVGSGKSTFLSAIMKELELINGSVSIKIYSYLFRSKLMVK